MSINFGAEADFLLELDIYRHRKSHRRNWPSHDNTQHA